MKVMRAVLMWTDLVLDRGRPGLATDDPILIAFTHQPEHAVRDEPRHIVSAPKRTIALLRESHFLAAQLQILSE